MEEAGTTSWYLVSAPEFAPWSMRRGLHSGSNTRFSPNFWEPSWWLESAQAPVSSAQFSPIYLPGALSSVSLGPKTIVSICTCRGCSVSPFTQSSAPWVRRAHGGALRPAPLSASLLLGGQGELCAEHRQPLPFPAQTGPLWQHRSLVMFSS